MKKIVYNLFFHVFSLINNFFGDKWRKLIKKNTSSLRGYLCKLRFLLHVFQFDSFGKNCSLGRGFVLNGSLKIRLDTTVTLRNNIQCCGYGILTIGEGTTINDYTIITCMKNVSIGKNVMIAPFVYILDVDHDISKKDKLITEQGYSIKKVKISDNVWIGTNSIITKGVHIGEGAVIGANSVVTKDVPPYTVYAGSPAILLKKISA